MVSSEFSKRSVDLVVRTERLAKRVLSAAIRVARRAGPAPGDQVVLALHSKVITNTRAVRLLCCKGIYSEAFGLHRAAIEAVVHMMGLTENPARDVDFLRRRILDLNKQTLPDDASELLESYKDDPAGLLSALYAQWAARQTQKAANDAAVTKNRHTQGRWDAAKVVEHIEQESKRRLGPTVWAAISNERHWHPSGYGHGGNATKMVFKRLGLELAYLVPFRFGSSSLHAADYTDYLDGELQKAAPRWEPGLIATAQQLLCKSSDIVSDRYTASRFEPEILALDREGNQLRESLSR